MLLQFTVGNFLSFKEPVTLSLEASSITDFPENTFSAGKYRLLKSAVVYGANASGKSNLLRALSEMGQIVHISASMSSADTFGITPFLLNTETFTKPSYFEILVLIEGIQYRYGFEITSTQIHTEWLYQAKASAEKPLFIRHGEAIEVFPSRFPEGKNLESKTRDNGLFLAVCDQFNGAISRRLVNWFSKGNHISGLSHENHRSLTFQLLEDPSCSPAMLQFLRELDLGFDEVKVEETTMGAFPYEPYPDMYLPFLGERQYPYWPDFIEARRFKTVHDQFDPAGRKSGKIVFDLGTQESSGTHKIFDLIGPFFDSLVNGKVLVVDELDAKLHPLLTKALVGLFNSEENNPHNAQLIFATHDTNLLTYANFRRDQIYFTEKDKEGASALYSLIEYKEEGGATVRKDRSFEKDYIQGRYGAIPYLGDFSKLFSKWQESKKSPTS